MNDADRERGSACGFDGSVYNSTSLVEAIVGLGSQWRGLLIEAGPELRVRPEPLTWSAIEYAAHSRDITALHLLGVEQALTEDEPVYLAIDADVLIETCAATYLDADADAVVAQLDRDARRLGAGAADAGAARWSRGITIGDQRSTVRRLLQHALHDSLHHLNDIERGLKVLRP